jgi:catabolite regulation protein CreA
MILNHRFVVNKGITIYLSDFDRPITEKLGGDLFNDPASSSLTCVQTGPVVMKGIDRSNPGELTESIKISLPFINIQK